MEVRAVVLADLAAQRLFAGLRYEHSGELRWIDDPGSDLYYSKAVKPAEEL